MEPIPTVNNQQPYIACSIVTNMVERVLMKDHANNRPPQKVRNKTSVFLKSKWAIENKIALIKITNPGDEKSDS